MIAISDCAADASHPFFQGLTLSAPLHGISELRFCCCPSDGGRPLLGHVSCFLATTVCPFLSRLHLCIPTLGPSFHLHPAQPPCEVKTLRYHEQKCQIYVRGFPQNILKLFNLLNSHLNGKQFVLARGEKSGGDVSFPTAFPLHLRLLLLFTCLNRKMLPYAPNVHHGHPKWPVCFKPNHGAIALCLVSSGCSFEEWHVCSSIPTPPGFVDYITLQIAKQLPSLKQTNKQLKPGKKKTKHNQKTKPQHTRLLMETTTVHLLKKQLV